MKNHGLSIPFYIQVAEYRIRIEPKYDMVQKYCKEYIVGEPVEKNPDLTVHICCEDIFAEKKYSNRQADKAGMIPVDYPVEYLEILAVYRKIAEWIPIQGTLLFHGSVIAVDGKAYLFTAKSGTGKSTHTRLWREYFGNRAVMINDDKPLIKITQDGVYAYGTPWDGKHRLSTNAYAPLSGICILRRGRENVLRKITAHEVYPMLMQQCYRPRNTKALTATMQILEQLKDIMNFYELHCNISKEAVEVAYNGMKSD